MQTNFKKKHGIAFVLGEKKDWAKYDPKLESSLVASDPWKC
jgi:hypothetical protein